MIRHVATTAGLVNLDPEIGERVVGRNHVGARDFTSHAKGDDWRMFEEQQEIGNRVGATLFDELSLQGERFVVPDQPKTTDLELAHLLNGAVRHRRHRHSAVVRADRHRSARSAP